MDPLATTFPVVIRKLRLDLGLSQEELARKADLHRTFISMIERGQRNPTLDVLERLAQALGKRPSELLVLCESPPNKVGA